MATRQRNDWEIPTGLSKQGRIAAKIIREFAEEYDLLGTGGCTIFRTPKEWKALGWDYGNGSDLVIVYEGAEIAHAFEYDHENYALIEKLRKRLEEYGVFTECGTSWMSAVYRIAPVRVIKPEETKAEPLEDVLLDDALTHFEKKEERPFFARTLLDRLTTHELLAELGERIS